MASKAIGVSKIEYGTVGDGVPPTSWTEITDAIVEGSVNFNFSEPTETKIGQETSDEAYHVITTKDDADYVEFALLSPEAATLGVLMGGTVATDKWSAATSIAEIVKSVKITTSTIAGEYIEYTIVNGKINARFDQAPSKKGSETVIVRVYVQAIQTAAGADMPSFIREIKSA